MKFSQSKFSQQLTPLTISTLYALFGGFWVLISDLLTTKLLLDPSTRKLTDLFKGWFFILFTAILLYVLINKAMNKVIKSEKLLKDNLQTMEITQEELSAAEDELRNHYARLQESEERYRELFNNMTNAVAIYEVKGDGDDFIFKDLNNAAQKIDNLKRDEVLGKSMPQFFPKIEDFGFLEVFKRVWRTGQPEPIPVTYYKDDRLEGWRENYIYKLPTGELVSIYEDVTARKKAEDDIIYQAHHDALTGLPNRLLFNDRLKQAITQAHRKKHPVATLSLDIDRFKLINDTMGHPTGDLLLRLAAERLKSCLREDDSIARMGGDEFMILLPELAKAEDAAIVAQKTLDLFGEPFILYDQEVFVSVSIGISIYPSDGTDAQTIIKNADSAMYYAKEQGRNNYQFFTASLNTTAFERLSLENSLRKAIERKEFLVHYQPLVNLTNGTIIGAEALVRWLHPQKGLISPAQFIPVAEDTGLIIPIGEWVLREACKQNRLWHDRGYHTLKVSVNLSPRQFKAPTLVKSIANILAETGLEPQFLELEITESAAMENADFAISMLQDLKEMGIKISIDDFGTGFSSLSYLKRFPIDTLKIDQAFVRDIGTNPDEKEIVTAIIALARNLNLRVIAEGVETEEQLSFLKHKRCDEMQGFLFSKPQFPELMEEMLLHQKQLKLEQ